jgi:hypothetical protein
MAEIEAFEASDELSDAVLRECLDAFSQLWLRVTGECMRPHLREGDVVLVARRRPRFGDVVLCRHPEGLRLHRLVWGPPFSPRGGSWRTQGDAAERWDPPLLPEQILGTVVEGPRGGAVCRPWTALLALLRGLRSRLRAHAVSAPA